MHPFYGPNGRQFAGARPRTEGLVSMAAYLAFWAVVVVLGKRELDARWPRQPRAAADRPAAVDPAMEVLRERFARGELTEPEFRAMTRILREGPGGRP